MVQARCRDLLMGISVAQENKCVLYLSQSMRDILTKGIHECLSGICDAAWTYYCSHDVPITDQTIPLLRDIVAYHFEQGGV